VCFSIGITTTTELAYMTKRFAGIRSILEVASREDGCRLRLHLYALAEPADQEMLRCCSSPDLHADKKRNQSSKTTYKVEENAFLKIAGIKIIADGSPHAGTMAILEPFLNSKLSMVLGFPEAPFYGHLNYSDEDLNQMVSLYHRAGKTILKCILLRAEIVTIFGSKMVTISARNTNIYKICKLHKAIFSVFYNIS
jgi:predicted amidohydrolase YtcJ